MLVIRMQRTGRKGHAQFRVVVQDSRRTPTSGKIVASLGHFNPHTKQTTLDKEKTQSYLDHGAQPSDRVARLLKTEGVKLPKWVTLDTSKKRPIRNIEKLRRNRPEQPVEKTEVPAAAEPSEVVEATPTAEVPAEAIAEESPTPPAEAETTEDTTPAAETETTEEAAPATETEPTLAETEAETAETSEPTTDATK